MKVFLSILILTITISFCSCGTPDVVHPMTKSGATWILNGITYTGAVDTAGGNQLLSSNDTSAIQLFSLRCQQTAVMTILW